MRLVVFTEKEPYKLEAGEQTYYLCMCGLSKKNPSAMALTKEQRTKKRVSYTFTIKREGLR